MCNCDETTTEGNQGINLNRAGRLDLSKVQSGVFRVMVWNIQLAFSQPIKSEIILSEIEAINPSIMLLQEPGPAGIKENEAIREMFQHYFDTTKIVTSSNRIVTNGWQYGGVLSAVLNEWVHKIDTTIQDPKRAGRFNAIRLRGKHGKQYTLFNIYRPHFNSTGRGTAALQRTLLNEYYPSEKSVKEVWIEDLFHLVDQELLIGNEVMIAGDFNLETKEKDEIFDEMRVREMTNCMETLYGSKLPPTREPGVLHKNKTPIDHVYVTKGFVMKEGCLGHFMEGSDHSYVVLDFFSEPMFHAQLVEPTPTMRLVHSSKPHHIPRFRLLLDKGIQDRGILSALEALFRRVKSNMFNEGDSELFSKLVLELDELTISASGQFKKRKKHRKLLTTNRKVLVWRQVIGWLKNPTQTKTVIKKKLRSIGENEVVLRSLTIDEARHFLKTAWHEYHSDPDNKRSFKQRRLRKRAEGLHELNPQKSIEQYQEETEKMEKMKQSHSKIKTARKKMKGAGVYMLETFVDGEKVLLTEKDQIEQEALLECHKKVHAADITPLKQEPLRSYLGVEGKIEQWEEWIQKGSFELPGDIEDKMDEGTKLFLEKVIHDKSDDIDFLISPEEYHASWRKQKENTSSAPGVNFSHLMCVTPDSLANKTRTLIANIRLMTGWNPECYLKATDSLLMKKKDNFTVKGMRLITLQHCACNHDNKLIGKWINEQGEKTRKFAIEQAGCRNRMRANEQALNKVLAVDVARGLRRPMAIIANDAKGCFDRIVLFAAFLVLRWLGIPFTVVKAMIESLLKMKHTVKTVFGESKETYGGDNTHPNGFCQGNGMAGQGFTALSSPLLDICKEQGHGAKFKDVLSGESYRVAGTMFVDDFDAMSTRNNGESNQQFVERTQEFISLWNNLLRTTGGALEPKKTHWCNFDYKKVRGKWKPVECEGDLEIPDEIDGQPVKLEKISVTDARRTLGVFQAVDGSQVTHMEYLLDIIRDFALKMRGFFLTQQEKMVALKTTITKSIEFGTTATYLSEKQSNQVTKELRKAILAGLGYSRTMPIEVVHGPREYNGIEVMDYDISQGAEHIRVLLDHWGRDTQTGRFLRTNTQLYDLIIGTERGFWATNEEEVLQLIPDSWIKNTKLFMIRNDIDISMKREPLRRWRVNDRFLMDMVNECVGWTFSKQELIDFNEVRLTLRVTTLSDIVANKRLIPGIWDASATPSSMSANQYDWPKSGNLSKREIGNWQLVLTKMGLEENMEVSHCFGGWYDDTVKYLASGNARKIQIQKDNIVVTYIATVSRGRSKRYEITDDQQQGEGGNLYTYRREGEYIVLLEECEITNRLPGIDFHDWTHPVVVGSETVERRFVQKLITGMASLVTDASDNKKNVLTAAFVEELPLEEETHDSIEGSIQIPTSMRQANSFRGELGGILAAVSYVTRLAAKYEIQSGRCEIVCDNIGSIKRSVQADTEDFVFQARMNSFDLLRVLQKKLDTSPIKFKFRHVYGHQDNTTDYFLLDDDARANVRADSLAKEAAMDKVPILNPPRLQEEDIVCYVNGNKLHGKILGTIWGSKYRQRLIDYWKKKDRFRNDEGVDWEVVEQANKKLQPNDRKMITKLLSGWYGNAEKMYQRGDFIDTICPICKQTNEDRRHLWRCQDCRTNWKISQELHALEKLLKKPMYDADLFPAVEALVDMYRHDSDTYIQRLNVKNKKLVDLQCMIGPNSFVEGILHEEWRQRCGGVTGVIILIRRLYKIWIALWKHRNDIVKGTGKDEKALEKLQDIIMKLVEETPPRLTGDDKEHFQIDIDQLFRRSIDDQRYWIRGARAIITKMKGFRSRGMLRYTEETLVDVETRKALQRQRIQRRRTEREKDIQRMIQWRPSQLTQDEHRIFSKGTTILQQDYWSQLRWLRQMQKLKKQYSDRWYSRNNLESWRMNNDEDALLVDGKDTKNGNIDGGKMRQCKITQWLVRTSNDEG